MGCFIKCNESILCERCGRAAIKKASLQNLKARILVCMTLFLLASSCVSPVSTDGFALLAFKGCLNASTASPLGDWMESDPHPCNWTGITCNEDLMVTGLVLPQMGLSGTISENIASMKSLQNISLRNNNFVGQLPRSIFTLSDLRHVDLDGNLLEGTIPFGFQSVARLEFLKLSNNDLKGGIPKDFASQSAIWHLDLSGNNALNGTIPSGIGSLASLRYLDINTCGLVGELPPALGDLKQLQILYLHVNYLEGPIPPALAGLDSLEELDISNNLLTTLPMEFGNLRSIRVVRLQANHLSGPIPRELAKLNKTLVNLDLADNNLSGPIPDEIGSLTLLILLHLSGNNLSGPLPRGVAQLTHLEDVFLYNNGLSGELPPTLGEIQPLKKFDAFNNGFTGPIPRHLCNKGKLSRLILSGNLLSGSVPDSLGHCPTLFRLRLDSNLLTGSIPSSLGDSLSLNYTDLSSNKLTGDIPVDLGRCLSLRYLSLSQNQLTGGIPAELGSLVNLTHFEAAHNNLIGSIPVDICSTRVNYMDLSHNILSGTIPTDLSKCKDLTQLVLTDNQLSGVIPLTFASMISLGELYLSRNRLEGPIPRELASSHLQKLDVSYNQLSGPVFHMGFLATLNASDYQGNRELCAENPDWAPSLEPCALQDDRASRNYKVAVVKLVLFVVLGVFLALFSWAGVCCCFCLCYAERFKKLLAQRHGVVNSWTMTMFHTVPDLSLEDILRALAENHVVGSGGSGDVFRGEIPVGKAFRGRTRREGQLFVVKRLKGNDAGQRAGLNDREFEAEVETLGNIRHHNVAKLLACCTDHEGTKLLVFEFMQNGSLGDHLHGVKGGELSWDIRLHIAVGAGQGLLYLHDDCVPPILHRDVTSNNVLLDQNFNAILADFGLAKRLQGNTQTMQTMSNVVGSRGYIAPELAYSMRANPKSDVYSYGVLLLELTTGRKAVEVTKGGSEGVDLVAWTRSRVQKPEAEVDVLDKRLGPISKATQDEMVRVMRVGLYCTNTDPGDRPCMQKVVRFLVDIQATSDDAMEQRRRQQNVMLMLPLDIFSTTISKES